MSLIRTIFEQNSEIIRFGYGLVFFVMGLAIAVQSRRYSRLELARSLRWLALFGLAQSFYEWGELFAPVQEAYLSPDGIHLLHSLHLIVLIVSFGCLLEFGVALLRPLGRGQWLRPLWIGILVVDFAVAFVVLPRIVPESHDWHNAVNALARYSIALPGGLLAAYGLREQTFRHIAPLKAPHIVTTLRVAGIGLALYGLFGGLLPPPVPFFPGSFLNDDAFARVVGVPPLVFHALIALILAATIIRALEIFEVETVRTIETMEQQQILSAERDRIARDLHDGVIQSIYTAGLLVESAQHLAGPESPAAARLEKVIGVLNEAIRDLRRHLGELRAVPSGESLPDVLRRLAEDHRFRSLVTISLDIGTLDGDGLSPARADHVLAVVNEALSNVVRHARARHVRIGVSRSDGLLQVTVEDDGIGLPHEPRDGYGLRNMRDRARLLGGRLEVSGVGGKGTHVRLDIPWMDER